MPLFRISGILISLHVTFFLLLTYFAWEGARAGGVQGFIWTLGLILLLFTCITLHELGHALTARRYHVPVPRILLTPIGGIAELGFLPEQPRREIAIILAGPATNFILVLLLLPWVEWPSPLIIDSTYIPLTVPGLLQEMLRFNLIMGLFNLLPVFPMDGGRLLRAGLATRVPYLRATRIAATIGQVLALLFSIGFLAIPAHPNLLACLLFVFIFFAARLEYRWVRFQHAFEVRVHASADQL